jgi:hypothetical protein
MRCVGVVECKAPGTQNSGKRPLLFFALAGRVSLFSCRQANVPTNMRRRESQKRQGEDDGRRALRLLHGLLQSITLLQHIEARCRGGVHAPGSAANDHCSFIELLMTAETSLRSGICTQGHNGEDCANGEISRMGLNGRVYEPRSVRQRQACNSIARCVHQGIHAWRAPAGRAACCMPLPAVEAPSWRQRRCRDKRR